MSPLSAEKPKDRSAHFKQHLVPYLKLHEASASLIKDAERVFLEGEDEPSEQLIKKLGWNWWLSLQPVQSEELWVSHFTRIKHRIGKDYDTNLVKYKSMGECIRWHLNVNAAVPSDVFGWSHQEDLQYFKFLLGETYHPEDFQFLGEKTDFPLDDLSMIEVVGWSLTAMMRGSSEAIDGKSKFLYPYWQQLVLQADPSIFEPESAFSKNAIEIGAKMTVARMILQALRPNYCKRIFRKYGKANRHGIIGRPLSMRHMTPDEFWDFPAYIEFREQLLGDIDKGIYPESIQRLKQWASRPESDPDGDAGKRHTRLMWSSENDGTSHHVYENPWAVKVKVKRSITTKIPAAGLISAEVEKLRDTIECYRTVLSRNGAPGFSEAFDTEEKLIALAKRVGRISNSKALDRLKDLLMYHVDEKFDVEILLFLVGQYFVDLSYVQEDDEKNESLFLREGWKDFGRAVGDHCTISKVSTRKVKEKIRVTIVAKEVHEYSYSMTGNLAKKLASDMNEFIAKEELPWQLHAIHKEGESGTVADGNTQCFYLPRGCAVWF